MVQIMLENILQVVFQEKYVRQISVAILIYKF